MPAMIVRVKKGMGGKKSSISLPNKLLKEPRTPFGRKTAPELERTELYREKGKSAKKISPQLRGLVTGGGLEE